jgi:hypothetical protein
MENKVLETSKLGTIGSQSVSFSDGQIVASANASADGITATISISISAKVIIDAIAAKIGGPIPQEIALFLDTSLGLK